MKKKLLFMMIIFSSLLMITGCSKELKKDKVIDKDASNFKSEYESFNGKENDNGKKYRKLDIETENPFVYKKAEDIVKMMDNKESFVVYFGFAQCPWCRSIIESLIEVADDLELDKIYYVDVKDIRDVKEFKDGKVVTSKEGSKGYYKLLEKLDDVLEDYTIQNDQDEEVSAEEKRLYAPSVVSVVNGEAKELETGIVDILTDPYMELTDEIEDKIEDRFQCSLKCVIENKNTCSYNKAC